MEMGSRFVGQAPLGPTVPTANRLLEDGVWHTSWQMSPTGVKGSPDLVLCGLAGGSSWRGFGGPRGL